MLYLFTSLSHFTLLGKKAERYMQKSSGGLGLSRGITAAPEGQIVSGVNFVLDYGKSLLLLIFFPPVFFYNIHSVLYLLGKHFSLSVKQDVWVKKLKT